MVEKNWWVSNFIGFIIYLCLKISYKKNPSIKTAQIELLQEKKVEKHKLRGN